MSSTGITAEAMNKNLIEERATKQIKHNIPFWYALDVSNQW